MKVLYTPGKEVLAEQQEYMPAAVRKVGCELWASRVPDRWIQPALHQVMQALFESEFCESSYGFRPGRQRTKPWKRREARLPKVSDGSWTWA